MGRIGSLLQDPRNIVIALLLVALVGVGIGWYLGNHSGTLEVNPLNEGGPIFSVASSTGDTYFLVDETGNVGVNMLVPSTTLDVQGTIRAREAFPPACNADIEGAITYDRLTKHIVGCTPAGWRILDN